MNSVPIRHDATSTILAVCQAVAKGEEVSNLPVSPAIASRYAASHCLFPPAPYIHLPTSPHSMSSVLDALSIQVSKSQLSPLAMTWESGEARKRVASMATRNDSDAKGYVTAFTMSNQTIIISPFPLTMCNSVKDVYPTTFFLSHMPELVCPFLQQLFNLDISVSDVPSMPWGETDTVACLPMSVTLIIQGLRQRCSCITLQDAHELMVAEWATGGSAQQLFPLETHVPAVARVAWTTDEGVDPLHEADIDKVARDDIDRTFLHKCKRTDVEDVKVEEVGDVDCDTLWDPVSIDSNTPFRSALRTCCCAAFQTRRYTVLRALLLVLQSTNGDMKGSEREGCDGDVAYLLEKLG